MTSPATRAAQVVDLIRRQSSPGQHSIDRDAAIALVEFFASVAASDPAIFPSCAANLVDRASPALKAARAL